MNSKFNSPEFKTIVYKLNNESGRYEKQATLVPFEKLPFELKVETTRDERIKNNGATEIITGRIKGGKRLFFTGLIHVFNESNWFYGNDYQFINGNKKNSLVIFQFKNTNQELIIYYFNSFYKDSREERIKFVCLFIQSIQ
jgi:hypothetical protein